jgi:hypothetical protein
MFLSYGSEKVKVALNSRSGISLETGLEKEQEELFVHQIWIKELHNLRSKLIHAEPITNRTWGWSPSEHLIIGTFIYPLIIKLTLQKAGAYTMTYEDEGNCFAIDKLLVENKWSRIVEGNSTAWSRIIFHSTLRAGFSANRRLLSR